MKTLVCLLSDQHVPNTLAVQALWPNRIILVVTQRMRKNRQEHFFQEALKSLNIPLVPELVELPEGIDNSFSALKKLFQDKITPRNEQDQLLLNLTGGTKPMSIALYEAFREFPGTEFYYMDLRKNEVIQNFLTGEEICVSRPISMKAFLAGYGYEIKKDMGKVNGAETFARKHWKLTQLLAKLAAEKNFSLWRDAKKAAEFLNNWGKPTKKKPLPDGLLQPFNEELAYEIANMFGLSVNSSNQLRGELDSYAVAYLSGGWLEEFVWHILSEQKAKLGMADVHLGMVVGKEDTNEWDVSFIRQNTLHVVECKTGWQKQMTENTYKLFSVAKQITALKIKTFLVSNSPNLEKVRDRAEQLNTRLIGAKEIVQLAESPGLVQQIFFR